VQDVLIGVFVGDFVETCGAFVGDFVGDFVETCGAFVGDFVGDFVETCGAVVGDFVGDFVETCGALVGAFVGLIGTFVTLTILNDTTLVDPIWPVPFDPEYDVADTLCAPTDNAAHL
jgi:hypothetical protein